MSTELEAYKRIVEEQQELLLDCLARIGLYHEHEAEFPVVPEDSPLAPLFVASRLAAEDLAQVTRERDGNLNTLQEKLQIIAKQNQAISELSTPVIDIWDEILVLPLIGTVDTTRAQQIIENLLETIVKKRASVVILDITGVPIVDTKVAQHFLKTINAARMLGARVILTGVSPHNAQTLVRLGVDLAGINTKSSLQAGLRLAFEMTHNRVVKEA